jgi:D-xylulose reductase
MTFAATPPFTGGTLGRYYALGADMCHKLPDNVDMEDGAMMEPLSVAVHALASVGNLKTDQNVAVYGCGPVGLLCMAVAKALGARRVIAIGTLYDSRHTSANVQTSTPSVWLSPSSTLRPTLTNLYVLASVEEKVED